jgi:hypothetical protein
VTTRDWHPAPLAIEVVAYEQGPEKELRVTITSVLRAACIAERRGASCDRPCLDRNVPWLAG